MQTGKRYCLYRSSFKNVFVTSNFEEVSVSAEPNEGTSKLRVPYAL
jgi:hypothetical protein